MNLTSSRNTGKVSNALAKVQMEMGVFEIDKEGYNFSYLSFAKILEIILPISGKHNLSIIQLPGVEVKDKQPWVIVVTKLSCEDEWIENKFSFPLIERSKKTDTEIGMLGSTVSYLRRYAIQSIFGIAGADKDVEEIQSENQNENQNEKE